MTTNRLATVLAVLGGLFLLYIGALFLLTPQTSVVGYGLPAWPQDQGRESWWPRACETSASDW